MAIGTAATCFVVVLTFVFISGLSCNAYDQEDEEGNDMFDPTDHHDYYEGDQGIYLPESLDGERSGYNPFYEDDDEDNDKEEEEEEREKEKTKAVKKKKVKKSLKNVAKSSKSKGIASKVKQMKKRSLDTSYQENNKELPFKKVQQTKKVDKESSDISGDKIKEEKQIKSKENSKLSKENKDNSKKQEETKGKQEELAAAKQQVNLHEEAVAKQQVNLHEEAAAKQQVNLHEEAVAKQQENLHKEAVAKQQVNLHEEAAAKQQVKQTLEEETPVVKVRMANIFDPDVKVNDILQSKRFQGIRHKQIIDYIVSHFEGQTLENDMLDMIDNLITSNLRSDLRKPDSRLSRLLYEDEEVKKLKENKQQINEENQKQSNQQQQQHKKPDQKVLAEEEEQLKKQLEEDEKVKLEKEDNQQKDKEQLAIARYNKEKTTEKEVEHEQERLALLMEEEKEKVASSQSNENKDIASSQSIENKDIASSQSNENKDIASSQSNENKNNQNQEKEQDQGDDAKQAENEATENLVNKEQPLDKTSDFLKSKRKNMMRQAVKGMSNHQHQKHDTKTNIEPVEELVKAEQLETDTDRTIGETIKMGHKDDNKQDDFSNQVVGIKEGLTTETISEDGKTEQESNKDETILKQHDEENNGEIKSGESVDGIEIKEGVNEINEKNNEINEEGQSDKLEGEKKEPGFFSGIFSYFTESESNNATEIDEEKLKEKDAVDLSKVDFPEAAEEDTNVERKDDVENINIERKDDVENINSENIVPQEESIELNKDTSIVPDNILKESESPNESNKNTEEKVEAEKALEEKIKEEEVVVTEKDEQVDISAPPPTLKEIPSTATPTTTTPTTTTPTTATPTTTTPTTAAATTTKSLPMTQPPIIKIPLLKKKQDNLKERSVDNLFSESVDVDHEKNKYTSEGKDFDKVHEPNTGTAPKKVFNAKQWSSPFDHLSDDDPLKALCKQHPSLQACKNVVKKLEEQTDNKKAVDQNTTKSFSISSYIKSFTRWMNGWLYFVFVTLVEVIRSFFVLSFQYTFGLLLSLLGQKQIVETVSLKFYSISVEGFALILVFIINHFVFYWYFSNSSMGPRVHIVDRGVAEKTCGISEEEVDELHDMNEQLNKKLADKLNNEQELMQKISKIEEENDELASQNKIIETNLKEEKVAKELLEESSEKLRQAKLECEDELSDRHAELKVANQTIQSLKKEQEATKAELKKMEEKFFFVIKELDTKDVKMMKLEEKEKSLHKTIEEKEETITELEDTLCENSKIRDEIEEEKKGVELKLDEETKRIQSLQTEVQVLQETMASLASTSIDTSEDFENVENDSDIGAEQLKAERLNKIIDVTKVQAELKLTTEALDSYKQELANITSNYTQNQSSLEELTSKYTSLNIANDETSRLLEKKEIELSTIRTFFADRENEYQKASALNTEEVKVLQKQLLSYGDSEGEVSNLMKRIEELKEEILNNDRQSKQQISSSEEQAHNNYIKMRSAQRECDEHKREKEIYRKRLLDIDVSPQFKKSTTPVKGDRVPSPSTSNKSGDENSSATDSPKPASSGPSMTPHGAMYSSYTNGRFGMPPPPPRPMGMFPPGGPRPPYMSPMPPMGGPMGMPPRLPPNMPPNMPPGMQPGMQPGIPPRLPYGIGQPPPPGPPGAFPTRPPYNMTQQSGEQRPPMQHFPQGGYNPYHTPMPNGRPTPPPGSTPLHTPNVTPLHTPSHSVTNTPVKN